MCACQVQAQEREVEDKDDIFSKVRIDTIHIKATPYERVFENGVWKDEDKKIEYYNDITIYEIRKKDVSQASSMMTASMPVIFMIPGGGFFGYAPSDIIGFRDTLSYITLGSKLADSNSALIVMVYYNSKPVIPADINTMEFVVFPTVPSQCLWTSNEKGKALIYESSYKAFYDTRKILRSYYDSAAVKQLDTTNFFMIGSSAGAILINSYLNLRPSEIPSSFTFKKNCSNADSTIAISTTIRDSIWNLPPIKGVVTMNGAWLYDSLSLAIDSNPNFLNTKILMMHGTCDEIINRNKARIGFKYPFFDLVNQSNVYSKENNLNNKFFPTAYGSSAIFKVHMNKHPSMKLSFVKTGGHIIFNFSNQANGAWDIVDTDTNVITSTVFNQVNPFISGLIANNLDWKTKTTTLNPSESTTYCTNFDNAADTVIYCSVSAAGLQVPTTKLCNGSNQFAYITNVPDDAVVTWTVPSWVQIVSGQGTKTLTFKRINAINSTANLTAKVKRECAQDSIILTRSIQSFAVNITLPASLTFSQPIVTPLCGSQVTAVVNNIPSGATPTWSRTGNITINSQNGGSVTYSRTSAINSTGILTLTLTTSCDTMKYNYTIVTKGNIGQGWTFNAGPLGISNICGTTIATQSVEPIPPSTTTTFSVTVTNASSFNIDTLEWEFNCGYISSPPIQTWSGNNLYSEVAVMANALNQGCTNVRVRPRNSCATGSWRTQNLSLQNCGGGFMMILYPNPSSTSIQIELRNDEDVKSLEKSYSLMVVDIQGQPILTTNVEYGKAEIDVSKLKEGQYKAIVWVNDTPLTSTFKVSR
jgi:hypothetical protein